MCAYSFMSRRLGMNVDLTPDGSHRVNNDLWLAYQDAGIKGQMLLWLVTFNIPVGPWHTDSRWHECKEALATLLAEHEPRSCPLFMDMAPSMLSDPAYADLSCSSDPYAALWQRLRTESPWQTKGVKVVKSRFLAFARRAARELRHIHARAFGYLYVCMEQGFLNDKSIEQFFVRSRLAEEPAGGTTSAAHETDEEKALRKSCANNLVLGCLQFNSEDSRAYLQIAVALSVPCEKWHGEQNTRLRSVADTAPWMVEQISGKFMAGLCDIVRVISQEQHLIAVPMILPEADLDKSELDLFIGMSFREDRLATIFADCAMALVGHRVQSTLWMLRGWPSRSVLMTRDDFAPLAATALRQDYNYYLQFSANPDGFDGVREIADRSIFKLKSVMQDVLILQGAGWAVTEDMVAHVTACSRRIVASQACEDCFNRQKNARKAPNRRGIVEKSWAVANERRILERVHRFSEPTLAAAAAPIGPLPPEVFRPSVKDAPAVFHKLPGFRSSPEWYSPGAASYPQVFSDLALIEFVEGRGLRRFVRNIWLGEMMQASHHILVRHLHDGSPTRWYFAVRFVVGSCALLWPADEHQTPSGNDKYFVPHAAKVQVSQVVVPIVDHTMWEAMPFVWRSPLGQSVATPAIGPLAWAPHAIRAFPTEPSAPLLETACKCGFWNMPMPFLKKVATLLSVVLPQSADAVAVLELLIKKICGHVDDELVLAWLDRRLTAVSRQQHMEHVESKLLDADDVQDCLSSHDKDDYNKMRGKTKVVVEETKAFMGRIKEKRQAVIAARASSAGAAKAQKRKPAAGRNARAARLVIPPGAITHAEAKQMAPVGAYVWRNQSSQTWHGKFPPLGEISRSWARYGHREAAILILQELWTRAIALGHCEACPIEGLMGSRAVPEVVASSST